MERLQESIDVITENFFTVVGVIQRDAAPSKIGRDPVVSWTALEISHNSDGNQGNQFPFYSEVISRTITNLQNAVKQASLSIDCLPLQNTQDEQQNKLIALHELNALESLKLTAAIKEAVILQAQLHGLIVGSADLHNNLYLSINEADV